MSQPTPAPHQTGRADFPHPAFRVSRTGSGFGVWGRCGRRGMATWGASAGGGTARGVEGAGNYLVDEGWCRWSRASICAERWA